MFAVSAKQQELSPHCMFFVGWWIYDLRVFHSFWKEKVKQLPGIYVGKTAWDAVLRAESISLFSDTEDLKAFSRKYHQFFKTKVSSKNIEKVFQHFRRLGLNKVGNLKSLPRAEIQKRFGKAWAEFLEAVTDPEQAHWKWQPFIAKRIMKESYEPDESIVDSAFLLEACMRLLNRVSFQNNRSELRLEKLDFIFTSFDSTEDQSLALDFSHAPLLRKNLAWMRRLLEERLFQIDFYSPVSRVEMSLQLASTKPGVQLSLFNSSSRKFSCEEVQKRLQTRGFYLFQPKLLPSHLPEESWRVNEPHSQTQDFLAPVYQRPLVQFDPKPISEPEAQLYFTERIQWIDEDGGSHRRDYYIYFFKRAWRWVFVNEQGAWFEQGLVE